MVDASQGVEAQTLANAYQAPDNNHEVVPVLNKVALPAAEPDKALMINVVDCCREVAGVGLRPACRRPCPNRWTPAQGCRRFAAACLPRSVTTS